jgi:uncharacterized MAPEG superfamily protein
MQIELQMLVFASILGLVQLMIAAQMATAQRGVKWNLSSRESTPAPLTGAAGRVDRGFKNFMETFPIFIVAVFVVYATQKSSALSAWGAQIYFYARVVHFLVYAAGITVVRTIVWCVSALGLALVFASLL